MYVLKDDRIRLEEEVLNSINKAQIQAHQEYDDIAKDHLKGAAESDFQHLQDSLVFEFHCSVDIHIPGFGTDALCFCAEQNGRIGFGKSKEEDNSGCASEDAQRPKEPAPAFGPGHREVPSDEGTCDQTLRAPNYVPRVGPRKVVAENIDIAWPLRYDSQISARIPPTTTSGDDPKVPPRTRMIIIVSIF